MRSQIPLPFYSYLGYSASCLKIYFQSLSVFLRAILYLKYLCCFPLLNQLVPLWCGICAGKQRERFPEYLVLECFDVLWWKVLWRLTLLVLYAHQLKMRDQWISCLVARLLRSKVCGQRAFSSHKVALVRGCASILHTRGSLAPRAIPPWSQGEAWGSAPKQFSGGALHVVGRCESPFLLSWETLCWKHEWGSCVREGLINLPALSNCDSLWTTSVKWILWTRPTWTLSKQKTGKRNTFLHMANVIWTV